MGSEKAAPGFGYHLKKTIEAYVNANPTGVTYTQLIVAIYGDGLTKESYNTYYYRIFAACRSLAGQKLIELEVVDLSRLTPPIKSKYTIIKPVKPVENV